MSSSTIDLRVRYAELAGDHVYYANYFGWLEACMGAFYKTHNLKFLGYESEGVKTMVAESYAKFIKPARYDDVVRVTSTLAAAAPKRALFEHTIARCDELLFRGATTHALLHVGKEGLQPFSQYVLSLANK
jgi:acyl-CoA thioester hydrolase